MKIRQVYSTDYPIPILLVDAADHITGKTGLTPTVTISKNGAAFASPAGAVTEIGNGWYALAGHADDRDTMGTLLLHATAAGADPVDDAYTIGYLNPFWIDLGSAMLDNTISSVPSAVATQIEQQLIEIDNLHKIGLELRGLEIATPSDDSYIAGGDALSGTVANTRVLDDSVWEIGNATSIDIRLVFDVPVGATLSAVLIRMVCSNYTTVSVSSDDLNWTSLGQPSRTPASYRTTLLFGDVIADDGKLYIKLSVSYYEPIYVNVDYAVVLYSSNSASGLTAQETTDAVHNLAPAGTPAANSMGAKLNNMPATILTTAVAAYAGTPGTFGYLLSLLAGLDFTAVNLVAASNAGEITIKRTLTLAAVVSGLTIPADWTACYWTVKRSVDDADADALAQILASNPPDTEDGLLVLAGAAVEDPTAGSLTVNQALGTVTIALDADSTGALDDAVEPVWDVKVHTATAKTQPGAGTATITTAVTRT